MEWLRVAFGFRETARRQRWLTGRCSRRAAGEDEPIATVETALGAERLDVRQTRGGAGAEGQTGFDASWQRA